MPSKLNNSPAPTEMINNHIERITHLETIQQIHAQSISALTKMSKEFTHMKYALYGALTMYVISQVGLVEVLKKAIL